MSIAATAVRAHEVFPPQRARALVTGRNERHATIDWQFTSRQALSG